jgi:hypothetical protein
MSLIYAPESEGDAMPHRTLTDDDIAAIAEAFKTHSACNLGLTNDEVTTLKKLLKAFNGAASLVGALILTALVGGLIAVATRGFWSTMVAGMKNGGTQ